MLINKMMAAVHVFDLKCVDPLVSIQSSTTVNGYVDRAKYAIALFDAILNTMNSAAQ
jgi:hypothetical protein